MDLSLVLAAVSAKGGAVQTQVATQILKNNFAAEKSAVATLLGGVQPSANPLANVAAGIGGNVDISA